MVHHLLPQVVDFGLKTPIFYKTHRKIITDSLGCIHRPLHPGGRGGRLTMQLKFKVHHQDYSHKRRKEMTKKGNVLGGELAISSVFFFLL